MASPATMWSMGMKMAMIVPPTMPTLIVIGISRSTCDGSMRTAVALRRAKNHEVTMARMKIRPNGVTQDVVSKCEYMGNSNSYPLFHRTTRKHLPAPLSTRDEVCGDLRHRALRCRDFV